MSESNAPKKTDSQKCINNDDSSSTENKSSRGRSSPRKRQLSKSSDELILPPSSRHRSLSQTRIKQAPTQDVTFKTQGQSFNMAQLIENTLMNKGIIQNAIPVIKGLIISDLQTQLIAELQETIKATVT